MVAQLWTHHRFQWSDRQGKYAVPAPLARGAPAAVRRARECSLTVRGARLFNQLPQVLQNQTCSFDSFKKQLDVLISSIPDLLTVPGLDRAAASNSLVDQIPLCSQGGNP